MDKGTVVALSAKSNHAKNRLQRDGEIWVIDKVDDHINTTKHRAISGPFIFIWPIKNPENSRWVSVTDDPDFSVKFVAEKNSENLKKTVDILG